MRKQLIFAFVIIAARCRKLLMTNDFAYKLLFLPGLARVRDVVGKWKAWYAFEKASKQCPAYTDFLSKHGGRVKLKGWSWVPDFSGVTPMDKPNYIKAYTIPERCHGGRIPTRGAVIDESSGSTGKPNNWVRGKDEREAVARIMQLALQELLGNRKQIMFVNAFALGPWATGMCVSGSIVDVVLLKSTGPDIDKIITTLRDFGPGFQYVIAGYPPFLKQLVDSNGVDWSKYDIVAFYGGEGMSEDMRTYLMRAFTKVYGDYGASDLEINVSAENDFTIEFRREMARNAPFRHAVNARVAAKCADTRRLADALPHVFQYNSMDYLVETNELGELLVTLCRHTNVAPKIRYNIHDNGHVMTYRDAVKLAQAHGVDTSAFPVAILGDLPLMFLYGRSDLSVGFYGCKITPGEVEKIIFSMPELAEAFNSFRLITFEDAQHDKQLTLAIELGQGKAAPADSETMRERIFSALRGANQDYRESERIFTAKGVVPKLEFHGFREGPFVGSDIRLKSKYTDEK